MYKIVSVSFTNATEFEIKSLALAVLYDFAAFCHFCGDGDGMQRNNENCETL